MTDEHLTNILDSHEKSRLFGDITLMMLKGAGYAAVVTVGTLLFVWILWEIGTFLPEEARQAQDPTPWSFQIELPDAAPRPV
jgi:hypothetical protein